MAIGVSFRLAGRAGSAVSPAPRVGARGVLALLRRARALSMITPGVPRRNPEPKRARA